jgi:hypothetical protein
MQNRRWHRVSLNFFSEWTIVKPPPGSAGGIMEEGVMWAVIFLLSKFEF